METSATTTTSNSLRAKRKTDYKMQPVTYAFMFLQREKTKEQYTNRLQLFFDFHEFPGTSLDKQGKLLINGWQKASKNMMLF